MFQGYHFGDVMVIVSKAPVSLTRVFGTCYSPDVEEAGLDGQSFQYTWLNSYFLSLLRESIKVKHT